MPNVWHGAWHSWWLVVDKKHDQSGQWLRYPKIKVCHFGPWDSVWWQGPLSQSRSWAWAVVKGEPETTWLAAGLGGTKAGEDTEAEGGGIVWPRPRQPAQDWSADTALNRGHPVPWTALGGGGWQCVWRAVYRFQGHRFCGWRSHLTSLSLNYIISKVVSWMGFLHSC